MNRGSATVEARANSIIPRPEQMPEWAKIKRLEWVDDLGAAHHIDDQAGMYWYHATLGRMNFKIGAQIPEGARVTVVWG